jgi:hypothetical protein
LTHWFLDSHADSLIHWFIGSQNPWYIHRLADSIINWFIGSWVHWIIDSLLHWFTAWFTGSLIRWLIGSLIHPFIDAWVNDSQIHWFVGFLIHWVIDSSVHMFIDRRKFRSQTSDLWTDVATVVRAVREEKKPEERRFSCAKRRKSRQHSVFPKMCDICGSAGSKSSLAKPAGAERSCTETLHI